MLALRDCKFLPLYRCKLKRPWLYNSWPLVGAAFCSDENKMETIEKCRGAKLKTWHLLITMCIVN